MYCPIVKIVSVHSLSTQHNARNANSSKSYFTLVTVKVKFF